MNYPLTTDTAHYLYHGYFHCHCNRQLPIAHVPLPTAHCPLPNAHCHLSTTHCPLPTSHCSPPPSTPTDLLPPITYGHPATDFPQNNYLTT